MSVDKARNVRLNDINNIELGATADTDISENLIVTAQGTITDAVGENLRVRGATLLNARKEAQEGNPEERFDITLDNAHNFNRVSIDKARNVRLNDINNIELGATTDTKIAENLIVTAQGTITDADGENLRVMGVTTLNAGKDAEGSNPEQRFNITLDNSHNFNRVEVTRGNNVILNNIDSIILEASTFNGNLTVTASDIDITGQINAGNNNIALQPKDNSTIALNDMTGAFNLTTLELQNLSTSGTVTIGRDMGTGQINIGSIGAIDLSGNNYNLTLNGGAVSFNNGLTLANNKTLTLRTGAITSGMSNPDITIGGMNGLLVLETTGAVGTMDNPLSTEISQLNATTNSGGLFLTNMGGIKFLETSDITGNLKLTTNGGGINSTGSLTVSGTTTLDAGSNDISLDNAANNFQDAVSLTGGTANLNDSDGIILGASNLSGNLQVTALGTPGITSNGAIRVTGTTNLNANGHDIALDNAANNFTGAVSLTGGTAIINDTDGITLGASTLSGQLNVTATDINITSQINAGGNITLQPQTSDSSIALNDATGAFNLTVSELEKLSTSGTVTIGSGIGTGSINLGSLGAINLSGTNYNLTLNGGAVSFTNGLTLANNKTLTLHTGAITSGMSNSDITIGGMSGKLVLQTSGAVGTMDNPLSTQISQLNATTTNSGNLFLTNTNTAGINLETSNINGDLKLTTIGGGINSTGSLTVSGTTTLDASSNNITLNNAANNFTGAVSLMGGTAIINDMDGITLGASMLSGDLTVTAQGITDSDTNSDAISVIGTTTLDANGNDITLDNANDFNSVVVSNGNNVTLNDTDDIELESSTTISGDLIVTANGNISDSDQLTVDGISNFTTTADGADIELDTLAATGSITLNTTGLDGNAIVTNNQAVNLNTSNIGGNLAVTANGNISDSGQVTVNGSSNFTTIADGADVELDTLAATGSINLNTTGSDGNATLTNNQAIDLGVSSVGGNLSVTATTGAISTSGDINAGVDVTLTADTMDIQNQVTGNGNLVLQPLTPERNIGIAQESGEFDLSQDEIAMFEGFNTITIGREDGNGAITINSVEFKDPVTIQTPKVSPSAPMDELGSTRGSITVNGDINGSDNASITLIAPRINLNGDITTNNQPITLGGKDSSFADNSNIVLGSVLAAIKTGLGAGDITFNGNINGIAGNQQSLQVSPGTGQIFFNGEVGNKNPLASLIIGDETTTNADLIGNSTTVFSSLRINAEQTRVAGVIKTTGGPVEFTGHVILVTDVTFDTTFNTGGSGGGDIIFGKTVSSAASDGNFPNDNSVPPFNLTLRAGSGDIYFKGAVGAQDFGNVQTLDLGQINVESADQVTAASTMATTEAEGIRINANIIDLEDRVNANQGQVELAANNSITTADVEGKTVTLTATNDGITTANVEAETVNISANDDITTANVTSTQRDTIVTSQTGSINTSNLTANQGQVNLSANNGGITTADVEADTVNLQANNDIVTANITATQGDTTNATQGQINLSTNNGGITTADVEADTVNLQANNDITTANVTTQGNTTVTSQTGNINTSNGTLSANQGQANLSANDGGITTADVEADTVNLQANNDITTANVTTQGNTTVTSQTGNINTSNGTLSANQGQANLSANDGGITTADVEAETVNMQANNDLTTANLTSTNGAITLNSQVGSVASNNLTARGEADNNTVTITAQGNVTASNIDTSSTTDKGGAIALTSQDGAIQTGEIISSGQTDGGSVTATAKNSITTGNVDSSSQQGTGGAIALTSELGDITSTNLTTSGAIGGGSIDALTLGQITLGELNSSSISGQAGSITLDNGQPEFRNDAPGIDVAFINAQGLPTGLGVDTTRLGVNITTDGYFRATGIFPTPIGAASVATGGAPIIIRHGGGSAFDPFEVGNAIQNGTAGAITNGKGFLGLILPIQSFSRPVRQDNIEIIPRKPSQSNLPFSTIYSTLGASNNLAEADIEISTLDNILSDDFSGYLGPKPSVNNPADAPKILADIEQKTGIKAAFVYATFIPEGYNTTQEGQAQQDSDRLELVLVTAEGQAIRVPVRETTRELVRTTATKLRREITNPIKRRTTSYLAPAQQLYNWLMAPIEEQLESQGIQNLVFIMDAGLRSLPIAVLHDGQNFLVEKYSVGLMPSLSLTDTSYNNIQNVPVLAMGISQANELAKSLNLSPLPAVPVEVQRIVDNRQGQSFLNEKFTLDTLISQSQTASIVHLATHAEFKPGPLENSYILLWNNQLRLDQLRQLGWNERRSPIELLVLSACRTAVGNEEAELGFAGLAVQAGVKSALSSLWYVSDEGTAGLMTEFYRQLETAPIKAEALRQAQLSMLSGQLRLEGGQLRGSGESITLPPSLAEQEDTTLAHPYYWGAFTMIGSPW
ncbi:CHAT domain-containing protein [Coleofasciculus sp. LEGE 07081]|uniref:CHAT domain-containing protein n=1 Tax=Coleofasciculus sp. LEGE 07081 TaxID=2777967 RepID=UPI002AD598AD|nr:CHAT domain-containing protein [Coleofasciculus sp. LEGE 07081]